MISISKAAQLNMSMADTAAAAIFSNMFSYNVAILLQFILKPFPHGHYTLSHLLMSQSNALLANKVAQLLKKKKILKGNIKKKKKTIHPHNADIPVGETQV